MNRLILAGMALLGCMTVACAETAGASTLENRSADWKQKVALAVNDATKAAGAIQAMPEADRAAFATDVLTVLQDKRQHMADKDAWAAEFAATAAALVSGAGGANQAVLTSVAAMIVNVCESGQSHELTKGNIDLLGTLTKSIMSQLPSSDRVAFANALMQDVEKQKTPNDAIHKQAMNVTEAALLAGAGDTKNGVLAAFAAMGIQPPPPPPLPGTGTLRPPGYQDSGIE